jgi:Holliday junction resolvase-like predicted endonuclease
MADATSRQPLVDEYARLQRLEDGHTPQSRGRRFNSLIADVLRSYGIAAQVSVRSAGEIDVAFSIGNTRYVLEAKWENTPAHTGHIAKLQKRVRQRLAGTYGIFLSMSGYSGEALQDIAHGERLEVLLLDAGHFEAMLRSVISPQDLLAFVQDQAAFLGQAYTPIQDATAPPHTLREPELAERDAAPTPQPAAPRSTLWQVARAERGNSDGELAAFEAYGPIYWIIVGLCVLLILLMLIIVLLPEISVLGKLIAGTTATFVLFLTVGFAKMARSPIRMEIGNRGIQIFARSEATWIPWEVIDRVDVVRIAGQQHLVAWSQAADVFPEFDAYGGGPRYLPQQGAIAVCSLGVLRAGRHQIMRALRTYSRSPVGQR